MGKVMTMQGEIVEPAGPVAKKKQTRAPRAKSDLCFRLELLSFVKQEKKKPRDSWAVDASSLSYHQQNKLGEAMAMELIAAVRDTRHIPLLTDVVFAWANSSDKDVSRGVMVGLLHSVCAMAAGPR